MLTYKAIHAKFKFNGSYYNYNTLNTLALNLKNDKALFNIEIGEFLQHWQDDCNTITLKTSGSTGTPKTILMQKQAMVNSALATGFYFNLKPKDKVLLCLPAHYIAGKMMLIRAMVLGLEIDSIAPKSKLNIDTEIHYNFAAMVPMQLNNSLNFIDNIKTIIVGGAKVSLTLQLKLQSLKTSFFETYGMTETVSHIAVKQLNHKQSTGFKTLPNIIISQDNRGCLVIDAPRVSSNKIVTNDVVKLISKSEFIWLGRADNIINSGGVKVFPEQIENLLSSKINSRFFIASESDDTLGTRVILIIESEKYSIDASVFSALDAFSKPKKTYFLNRFIETTSGKIQRKKTLQLLKK